MPSYGWASCEREDAGDARAEGLMGRQVSDRCERGVTGGSVELLVGTWSGRQECGVAGKSVKMMEER